MTWNGEYSIEEYFNKSIQYYPKMENLIEAQKLFNSYFQKNPQKLILRYFSEMPTRGRVYQREGKLIASSDNEGCCGFYEMLYGDQVAPIVDLFDQLNGSNKNLAWQVDEHEEVGKISQPASDYGFSGGGNKGYNFRNNDLKLSHYLAAAEGLAYDAPLAHRSARFLSPLNILLTPKLKRKNSGYRHEVLNGEIKKLNRNDVGETKPILEILHDLLIEKILQYKGGQSVYDEYSVITGNLSKSTPERRQKSLALARSWKVRFQKASGSVESDQGDATYSLWKAAQIPTKSKRPILGQLYTPTEISGLLGGNSMPAIGTSGGQVLWAKFKCNSSFNPEGPSVIGIHSGESRTRSAKEWCKSKKSVDFFFSGGNQKHEYLGKASAEILHEGSAALAYAKAKNYPEAEKVNLILHITLEEALPES